MSKFFQVIKHEYLHHVKQKRFIFALLSLPFFTLILSGVTIVIMLSTMDSRPAGYIDQSGLFPSLIPFPEKPSSLFKSITAVPFITVSAAESALADQSIQAYFVIDPDYFKNGQVQVFVLDKVSENVVGDFGGILRFNLAQSQDPQVASRLSEGTTIVTQTLDGTRSLSDDNILGFILPMLSGVLFMIAINTSGGYLLQALVEEKENRTMEIMITSIPPKKLMAAKTIGNLAVGLTQMIVWLIFGWGMIQILQYLFPQLGSFQMDARVLLIMILTLLPAFIFIGALMATVGAIATEHREAQQVAGLFTLPIFIPYWFMFALMQYPNSPLSVSLSLFPFTAPIALPLRAAFTTVPAWQVLLSVSLLFASAIAAIWLAGKAFQVGMLRYGKRVRLREIFRGKQTGAEI